MLAVESSPDELPKWESKVNKEDIKIYIKKGGSAIDNKSPYIKSHIHFNSYYSIEKMVEAVSSKAITRLISNFHINI